MGRAPCCDKANVKKGPWSPEEDAKLKSYIDQHGTGGNWIALPQKIGLKRCGKSCRLRWLNYLRPNIKHGGFSEEEDNIICSLYISIGSRWSIIAAQLPGRTDNDIKNYWNTRLKKKLLGSNKHRKINNQQTSHRGTTSSSTTGQLLKQEMITMRGTGLSTVDSMEANMMSHNQNPYWPELPILAPTPYSTEQQPRCDDHESIRKLLIRLGGKFSDEHNDHYNNQLQLYNEMLISSNTSTSTQPPDFGPPIQYNNNSQILPGQSSGTKTTNSIAEIEESRINYNSNPGQVGDGLEFFYGSGNDVIISGSAYNGHDHQENIISWGDQMSSLVYDGNNSNVPIINVSENYPGSERDILSAQECIFGESCFPKALREE